MDRQKTNDFLSEKPCSIGITSHCGDTMIKKRYSMYTTQIQKEKHKNT